MKYIQKNKSKLLFLGCLALIILEVLLAVTAFSNLSNIPFVYGSSQIVATKIGESENYPEYSIGGVYGVAPWCPTIYFPYQGRHKIILILSDEIRDWDLQTGVASRYQFSSPIPLSGNTYYKLHTINHTITDTKLTSYIYCSLEPRTNISIYEITYDIMSHERTADFAKNVTYPSSAPTGEGTISHSAVFYNYLFISGEGSDEGKIYRINLKDDTYETYSYDTWFWYVSDKLFTRESDGQEYVIIGRHLSSTKHRTLNIHTMEFIEELDSAGGGSPRSSAGNPYKAKSTLLVPLTNGGVVSTNNSILWYDPRTLTKLGETGFPLYDENGQFRDDFVGYPGDWFNWPYGMQIICAVEGGKYFAVGNINQCHAWFLLDATTFALLDYGVLSDFDSDWYGAVTSYGDGADPTNWAVINREEDKVYHITNVEEDGNFRLDLWEIDFSELNVIPDSYNEYCYWFDYIAGGEASSTGPSLSLHNLPLMVAQAFGITVFSGGLFVSSCLILAFILPVAIFTRSILPSVVVGFVVLGFLTAIGWMPYWILLIIVLVVAGLWGKTASNIFMRD